ncbi:flagellar biosynthetic protein FliO [Halobacteriovorax sp. JY17]|uniref:flagellar biosynthetic protein FliO n=1 Tax=Halobacteriovorax sp. JY17 TaxID=2014617 RepID=UPI0025BB07C4|nr:flagellar biosynthetic protein FliO [Halobacteriovorax sp. JY17]
MKKILTILTILFSVSSLQAGENIKVKSLKYSAINNSTGEISIQIEGNLESAPELTIKDSMIQVALKDAVVWPKIEKKITLNKNLDSTIMAYQFNKEVARVRAMLPYSIKGLEDRVSITISGDNINLQFPRVMSAAPAFKKTSVAKAKQNIEQYDESYLDKLIKEKEQSKAPINKLSEVAKAAPVIATDKVNVALSGIEKDSLNEGKSSFSLTGYIGKFVAFLGVVLLLFYGVVALMKKGVLKKGKLGFLNSTKVIEVINTTYVGPKRSLMLVKAHKQVFLVANTEKGMEFLSEVNDISGLIKDGEKSLSGNNFDSDLGSANLIEKSFNLKEDIEKTADQNVELNTDVVKDSVKLSQKIKEKVKTLKPLQ